MIATTLLAAWGWHKLAASMVASFGAPPQMDHVAAASPKISQSDAQLSSCVQDEDIGMRAGYCQDHSLARSVRCRFAARLIPRRTAMRAFWPFD